MREEEGEKVSEEEGEGVRKVLYCKNGQESG